MTTSPTIRRDAAMSALTLIGGVSLAVIPAATLSISSRIFTTQEQGAVSVAVMVATFAAQVTFAAVVESRLSSQGTERRVRFPAWLVIASLVAAIAVCVMPTSAVVLCLSLPVLLAGLEVGRGVSLAERFDHRELWAAVVVGAGAGTGVIGGFLGWNAALVPLAVGLAVAALVRSIGVPQQASRAAPRVTAWVIADVSVTGMIYPVLNALILAFLGPVQAVLFAAISTVSGLLAIPLNYLRLRLLKAHSSLDLVVSVVAVLLGVAAIAVFELTGVFEYVFGSAWTLHGTAAALGVACLWRASSLASTLPFTALRRMGHVKLLTFLRGGCALVTLLAGMLVLGTQSITALFAVLLAGEFLQTVVYELARRRAGTPRPHERA